jgi:type IV secretory pathway VirB10-like protein
MSQNRLPRPALGAALLAAALATLACGGESRTAERPEAADAIEARQDQPSQPIESQEPPAGQTDGQERDQYSDLAPPPLPDLDADREAQAAERELDERERALAEREQRLAERERARLAERERPSAPAERADRTERADRAERERQARRDAELEAERREVERQAQREADDAARTARRQEEARGREEVAQREDLPAEADDRAAPGDSEPAVVSLPAGSSFEVELGDTLSSQASEPGDIFRARVTADVYEDGALAIPRGSSVVGEVTQAQSTRRVGGRAVLGLRFSDLVLPTGETVPLAASLVEQGRSETGRDAATIGGGAAAGAILGRIFNKGDKGRGAILGAILGAAAGTAVAARTPGEEVTIPEGAVLTLRLDDEIEVRRRPRR